MSRRLWAHLALVAVGLIALGWALTAGLNPSLSCRGVPMGPGDTCANAQGTRHQTYEERLQASRDAVPVVVGVGVLLIGFGGALARAEVRGAGSSGRTRPDLPPAA